jgi:DNA-directed RNA polymerase sigma subunit (sigma70/sigma32)
MTAIPHVLGERRLPDTEHARDRMRNQTIRQRYALGGNGNTLRALGREFNLTAPRIHQIVNGRRRRTGTPTHQEE